MLETVDGTRCSPRVRFCMFSAASDATGRKVKRVAVDSVVWSTLLSAVCILAQLIVLFSYAMSLLAMYISLFIYGLSVNFRFTKRSFPAVI